MNTCFSACAPAHVQEVGKLFDGALLKKLEALIAKFGPELAPIMPQLLTDLAAGQYLAAFMLIVTTLANPTPTPAA